MPLNDMRFTKSAFVFHLHALSTSQLARFGVYSFILLSVKRHLTKLIVENRLDNTGTDFSLIVTDI